MAGNHTQVSQIALCILLGILGLGAIGGGVALLISPSGELMGMPLSMLDNSPFTSFFIPGLVLFLVLGLMPLLLIIALVKKPESKLAEQINIYRDMHWSWTFSIYMAFTLVIWIQIQMILLQAVHWLHTFYVFFAIAMVITALLPQTRSLYKM